MVANVQAVGVREQLERVRIGDGQRRHVGHLQRRQHAVNHVQNLRANVDAKFNQTIAHTIEYKKRSFLIYYKPASCRCR